jgi:CelD/BcsL family acetyltransferase involved in cellulose biosynthesis
MHTQSPCAATDSIVARVTNSMDGLEILLQDWESHGSSPLSPMQQLPWIKACIDTFASGSEISAVHVCRKNQTLAIAPLYRERGLFSKFELPGVRLLLEPSDFVYSDAETLDVLADKLAELGMPLSLYRLPGDSIVPAALKRAYKGRARVVSMNYKHYPFIDLAGFDDMNILSSRLRQDIRRARRKADNQGVVSFEVRRPEGKNDFLPMYQELLDVEAASWKGQAGTALVHDDVRRRFYEEYGTRASELGILRMCFMRINDLAIAAQFAVESGQRFWLFKIGYSDEYASCSPGMQLINETLHYAAGRRLLSYEFLGMADQWTRRWTRNERKSLVVAVYPYTPGGLLAFMGDAGRYVWSKLLKKQARYIGNLFLGNT